MSYISSFSLHPTKKSPFPFNIPVVHFAKNIEFSSPVTFFIGDNGSGKSTLLETLAYRLQLPYLDGSTYSGRGFQAAKKLLPHLKIEWALERSVGFFFRAEDFGDFMNSVDRSDERLHKHLESLVGEVPDQIIKEMKDSANSQLHHVRQNYGQELQSFSHGEAYLHIMQEKIQKRGIFLLDEPEAALSPSRQLALLYFIRQHLKNNNSQFIIATHSPLLMAFPGSTIYEITEEGMDKTELEYTEHFSVTKSFLNNPEAYLRRLEMEE